MKKIKKSSCIISIINYKGENMKIIDTSLKFLPLNKRARTDTIILHHAVYNGTVNGIHNIHLNKGWSGIGYHFYIRKDGSIYRGRPEDMIGAHAYGFNSTSIGICFEGNFEIDIMGVAQILAGNELVNYLKDKWKVSKVIKHKDINATACPR
jgi:N-acetyl-anhydromuramyl-L-alanine amidase AmpD